VAMEEPEGLISLPSRISSAVSTVPHVTRIDIVVIGSGGSGLAASVAALDRGATVIVLEQEPVPGGNTKLAAGGMNAAETKPQAALGIQDKVEIMIDDTMRGGRNINDPELVDVLAHNSSGSLDWLTSIGADLTHVGRMGGASVNRSHRPTGGAGVRARGSSMKPQLATRPQPPFSPRPGAVLSCSSMTPCARVSVSSRTTCT
jgi:succinate dehydrogenase/fumarate reductase flavoprotein subunit